MRELSSVELDLIVGGYGETGGGDGFDESAYVSQATANEDGTYSLTVSEAEFNANVAAAEAEYWTIEGCFTTYDANGNIMTQVRIGRRA